MTGAPDGTVSITCGTATGVGGRVVVGRDGRVFEVETTVTYTGGTVTYHYGHTAVGETAIERPGVDGRGVRRGRIDAQSGPAAMYSSIVSMMSPTSVS